MPWVCLHAAPLTLSFYMWHCIPSWPFLYSYLDPLIYHRCCIPSVYTVLPTTFRVCAVANNRLDYCISLYGCCGPGMAAAHALPGMSGCAPSQQANNVHSLCCPLHLLVSLQAWFEPHLYCWPLCLSAAVHYDVAAFLDGICQFLPVLL